MSVLSLKEAKCRCLINFGAQLLNLLLGGSGNACSIRKSRQYFSGDHDFGNVLRNLGTNESV